MPYITKLVAYTRQFCQFTAFVSLIILLAVVAVNILARLIFDLSDGSINFIIRGAIEISSYALLIFVFGALASALPNGLVNVEILSNKLPATIAKLLAMIWAVILVVGAITLAFLFVDSAQLAMQRGELTQDLEIPLWIFYAAIAIQCFALSLIAIEHLINIVRKPVALQEATSK